MEGKVHFVLWLQKFILSSSSNVVGEVWLQVARARNGDSASQPQMGSGE